MLSVRFANVSRIDHETGIARLTTSLTVALLDHTPGWHVLLDQIGLTYRVMHNVNELEPESVAVLIVNRHLWFEERERILAYVRAGGAVLDVDSLLREARSGSYRRPYVSSVQIGNDPDLFGDVGLLDLHCRVAIPKGRSVSEGIVGFQPEGMGVIGRLGFDPGRLMLDTRAMARAFVSPGDERPSERVGRTTKGGLEIVVRRMMTRLFHLRGLPFLRKRPFPGDAPSVMCFRIDSDYGSREQIAALYDVATTTDTRMTWFLHVEAHREWLDSFAGFEEQEIALHCFRHRTFATADENRLNIELGLKELASAGIQVTGFSAPNGIWNHNLAEVLDSVPFLYSSEFSLAYDALPFCPMLPIGRRVNAWFYRAMQIPVHPVSVGNLARVRMSEEQMLNYYISVAERKRRAEHPLIFYHHPTHERWDLLAEFLNRLHSYRPAMMTFTEYALWWHGRSNARYAAEVTDNTLTLSFHDRPESVLLDVLLPDGRRGIIREDGGLDLNSVVVGSGTDLGESIDREDPAPPSDLGHRQSGTFVVRRRALHDWIIRMSR